MTNHITLSDGRTLGYREYGAPDGFPIINNHGGLVCGLDISPAHPIAQELGIRIISPDRPGLCDSSPLPGRTMQDWANDVRQLSDQLHLTRFGVLGWSMGGQYALACGHFLADRVTAATVIAGCLPLDDPKNFAALNHMDRQLTEMAQTHPQEAALAFKAMGEVAKHTPSLWNTMSARGLCESDAETIHRLPPHGLAQMAEPALNSSEGMVAEYRAWVRPWGFAPQELNARVLFWQGDQDTLVPPAWANEFSQRLPNSKLNLVRDQGHFLAYNCYAEIFRNYLNPNTWGFH